MRKMKAATKPQENKDLQMGVAKALWSIYQYALPQVPGLMSLRIMHYLNKNGYLGEENLVKGTSRSTIENTIKDPRTALTVGGVTEPKLEDSI